jgi:Caspase domain
VSEWNPPDRSRSQAVLIGTSQYTELTQVPAAANSLESMYRLLTGPLCGWPADRVTRIPEPKAPGNLPDQLVELFGQARDVALFYYVGHGRVDFEDQLCLGLAGSRAQSERQATTSLTFEAVRHALRASPAATKVVILDCCFAGLAVKDRNALAGTDEVDITALAGASGAYTLAATGPASTAWFESGADTPLPHTHFTRALVDAVTRGIPGAPAVLTLEPVYHRLREILPATGKPAPTRVSRHNADTFVFARNAAPGPEPAPPPPVINSPGDPAARRRLLDMAEEAARTITEASSQFRALIGIAIEAARDDADRARRLLEESERGAGTITDRDDQALLWWSLASATEASDPARARGFLAAYEQAVTDPGIPEDRRNRIISLSPSSNPTLLRLDPDRTERLAHAITDQDSRGWFVSAAVEAVAARDPGRAERLTRIVSDDAELHGAALGALVYAVRDHDPDRAERIARAITDVESRCRGLADVAAAVAPNDLDRAEGLLDEAQRAADRAGDPDKISSCCQSIALGLTTDLRGEQNETRESGREWLQDQARRIIRKITSDKVAAGTAITVANALLDRPADARRLLEDAQRRYRDISDPWRKYMSSYILRDAAISMLNVDTKLAIGIVSSMVLDDVRDQAYLAVIRAISAIDPDRAEFLAHHVAQPGKRSQALSAVAAAMAENNRDTAATLLEHARRAGRAAGGKAPAAVALEIAVLDPDLAVKILTEDSDASLYGEGLAGIAKVTLKNDPERAEIIARDIADPAIRSQTLTQIATCYANSAEDKKA